MNVLLIVCELSDSAPEFLEALEEYPVRAQLTSSTWLVQTPRSAADVLESLDPHLTSSDRLFVGTVSGDAAWRNIEAGYDWLDAPFGRWDPREEPGSASS